MTVSTFNFRPRKTDHEKVLTCRAENTEVVNSAIEDSWRITVHCKYYNFSKAQETNSNIILSIMVRFN